MTLYAPVKAIMVNGIGIECRYWHSPMEIISMFRFMFALAISTSLLSAPLYAQDKSVGKRVDRLEKELRAVQRKVFPGGGKFFEPEITPQEQSRSSVNNSSSAVTDLIARVDAMERQLANVTGQVEENGFRLKKLEEKVAGLSAAPAPAASDAEAKSQDTGKPSASRPAAAAVTKPTASNSRTEQVAAIVKPISGDDAEDAYIYGYRLWEAKFFPEAATQLAKTAKDHPKHRRTSFAKNLEGRSYLDDGKPAKAAKIFYANYQEIPRGERAPDSLYFLGVSLTRLGNTDNACRVFGELQDVYPGEANSRLADRIARGKKAAKC